MIPICIVYSVKREEFDVVPVLSECGSVGVIPESGFGQVEFVVVGVYSVSACGLAVNSNVSTVDEVEGEFAEISGVDADPIEDRCVSIPSPRVSTVAEVTTEGDRFPAVVSAFEVERAAEACSYTISIGDAPRF